MQQKPMVSGCSDMHSQGIAARKSSNFDHRSIALHGLYKAIAMPSAAACSGRRPFQRCSVNEYASSPLRLFRYRVLTHSKGAHSRRLHPDWAARPALMTRAAHAAESKAVVRIEVAVSPRPTPGDTNRKGKGGKRGERGERGGKGGGKRGGRGGEGGKGGGRGGGGGA
jgi:uncharacterized membrane protein YgcG